MTVAEVIEELLKLPHDAVCYTNDGMGISDPVRDLYFVKDTHIVWVNT